MSIKILLFPLFPFLLFFCKNENRNADEVKNLSKIEIAKIAPVEKIIDTSGFSIKTRFNPPEGFVREMLDENSFQNYLENLPLKPHGTPVYLYNKEKKYRQNVHAAVIEMDTGKRDLQQCADAVMRLRAEYLFGQKKYGNIHFNFTNGFNATYSKWRSGNRISVKGNEVKWVSSSSESTSYKSFRKYLDMVFGYAGTWSLEKEMNKIDLAEMQIGDVFIQGGSPGHAIIVVDMAVNKTTNKKVFMLAQSYMPAQDMHVLKKPNNKNISPWYELGSGEIIETPEWDFNRGDLKRF